MIRPCNNASPADVARILKSELSDLHFCNNMPADLDSVVQLLKPAIVQVLKATPRPTKALLTKACKIGFPKAGAELGLMFAQRFLRGLQH